MGMKSKFTENSSSERSPTPSGLHLCWSAQYVQFYPSSVAPLSGEDYEDRWRRCNSICDLVFISPAEKHPIRNLHCIRAICFSPILLNALSTAASAFSNVVVPSSGGHHFVRADILSFDEELYWPITSSTTIISNSILVVG